MERSITERLQHLYAAFAAGDLDVIERLLDPEVEFHNPTEAVEPGVRRGPRAFRAALQSLHESFEYSSLEVEQMIERGDEVVVVARIVGRGKVSGVPIDQRFGYVWTTRNGRIVRFEWFVNADEALRAAGVEADGVPPSLEQQLRRGYEALSEGDIDTVLDLLDPDVEIRDRPEAPDASVHQGHEGVREVFETNVESFETVDLVPERFIGDDEHMVVVLLMRARGRGSGVPVEERIAHLWRFDDGRAKELQVYSDPADAIADAGMEP